MYMDGAPQTGHCAVGSSCGAQSLVVGNVVAILIVVQVDVVVVVVVEAVVVDVVAVRGARSTSSSCGRLK